MHFKLVNQKQQGWNNVGEDSILILCLVPFPQAQSSPLTCWENNITSSMLIPNLQIIFFPNLYTVPQMWVNIVQQAAMTMYQSQRNTYIKPGLRLFSNCLLLWFTIIKAMNSKT